MDLETAKRLCQINTDFYRKQSAAFSATRQSAWAGWERSLEVLAVDLHYWQQLRVLDLACGNLRFESFLRTKFPDTDIDYYGVDNCATLIPEGSHASYQNLDIIDLLLNDQLQSSLKNHANACIEAPLCDLCVCFGFMHHIPMYKNRERLLSFLINQTRSCGYLIVTFWQFLNDKSLAAKAEITHDRAKHKLGLPELEENDYLLGWQDNQDAWRYCHHFSDNEIRELINSVSDRVDVLSQFGADGRSGTLNSYLVMKVR
jgi:SAM-dependent methyltransferase